MHGAHPGALNRRATRCVALGRPARPLTALGLLEPQSLLLRGGMTVRSGAREVPIRDLAARRRSLCHPVGTRTAAGGGLKESVAMAGSRKRDPCRRSFCCADCYGLPPVRRKRRTFGWPSLVLKVLGNRPCAAPRTSPGVVGVVGWQPAAIHPPTPTTPGAGLGRRRVLPAMPAKH